MKKTIGIVMLLLALSFLAQAQRADINLKGRLVDTSSAAKPISDATVSLLNSRDSSLVTFTLSNAQGVFEIKGVDPGQYRLIVSHQEYTEIIKVIQVSAGQKEVDLGEFTPAKDLKTLGEVIVTSQAPIIVKGDTTQFNAGAFNLRPNSTAEDLLKKLPGVEVDRDGNVKAQGETVQKIYVDGKEFFGNDPKLATQNITADMIESIQVFDDMSEQARFTKIDDGSRVKTINIKLKKNRNKGYFGRVSAGITEKGRYRGNIGFNKFKDDQRISVIFNTNNLNEQGFSFSDVAGGGGVGGRGSGGGGGGTGLTKSTSTGINYSDQWGSKVKITGSYFFSNSKNMQEQQTSRQTFFTEDSIAVLNRWSFSNNKNQNHRVNLRLEYFIDSNNSLLFTPSVILQHSENNRADSSFTNAITPTKTFRTIRGGTANNGTRDGLSWNNEILFRHRFRKIGRTFTLGWKNTIGNSQNDGLTLSENIFFDTLGNPYRTISQNQRNDQDGKTNNNVISASYTEPMGSNKMLELNYAYTHNYSTSDRKVMDYNTVSKEYDLLNLPLTNNFNNKFVAHRYGVNYQYRKKKYNYQLGLGIQQSLLQSDSYRALTNKDSTSKANYTNFFPTASFNFTPVRSKNLRFRYSGRTNQPTIAQLQNVLNVSDPLHVTVGNPELKQEFNHNFNLSYNTFNVLTYRLFNAGVNFSTTQNRIVNSIDTLEAGVQLTQPQNVNGNYNFSTNLTLGFPFKNQKWKGSNVNFNNNLSYSKDIGLVYKQLNVGTTLNITQGVGINLSKENFDFNLRANVTYTSTKYSVNKTLNAEFFTQTYSGDFYYNFPHDISLTTGFDYYVNTGRAAGFNQSIPLWTASIAKVLFKKKNGEVRLHVNDILNQNESISRSTGDNYIQDTRSMVLRRYFRLSFLYNINRMGGNTQQGGIDNNRRGGGGGQRGNRGQRSGGMRY